MPFLIKLTIIVKQLPSSFWTDLTYFIYCVYIVTLKVNIKFFDEYFPGLTGLFRRVVRRKTQQIRQDLGRTAIDWHCPEHSSWSSWHSWSSEAHGWFMYKVALHQIRKCDCVILQLFFKYSSNVKWDQISAGMLSTMCQFYVKISLRDISNN